MPDVEIWRHALTAGEVIVSKDRDFLDLAAVRGSPPVLLLIALGNTSTDSLLHALESAWPQIRLELARPEAGVVTLEPERLVVLHR